ncbi:MAG TPA: hypothetical protein VKA94_05950, partial [Hyphomicrobiales bacterium]|nr:hypothetical protein [Hyphomicrobiales bacterium]
MSLTTRNATGLCRLCAGLVLGLLATAPLVSSAQTKSLTDAQRDRAERMLDGVQHAIADNYYDPTFHGVDLDKEAKLARQRIADA